MEIKIEKIVYPGKAMGRGEDGIATFVEGALPGEVADVIVTKSKKSFKEAKLGTILQRSALRIQPECPSFTKCGGCTFQHISYDTQLTFKKQYISELLRPVYTEPIEVIPSPELWGYRNKMEFSFFDDKGTLDVGLHQKGEFNRYFPVPPCLIADKDMLPVMEAILKFARGTKLPCYDKRDHTGFYRHLVVRKAKSSGQLLVNLVTNSKEGVGPEFFAPLVTKLGDKVYSFYWTMNSSISDAVRVDKLLLLSGSETFEESITVKGRRFSFIVSPFSFFQTNTSGAEILYELAVSMLKPEKTDTLLDLYCGTGTIGMTAAPLVKEVYGVEQVEDAVKDAERNKERNKIENIQFAAGSVEKWIKHAEKPVFNSLILDPPRGGISTKVVKYIDMLKPEKIVYVSCNPSTLARDLALIRDTSGYKIDKITAVDMFPQTYHIEVVTLLTK